ncbi:hypothetical protein C3B44_09350 [Corynebacterium yudongzhengii]|uniref:Uncharacterized protein n=1 Tax=Corynebacterium yudongzhengii TaxID=2080740 RepID=A0A2U1T8U0_9CORY|nr:hypothetical protein [Corynebacterium yudongzhengii]AWB82531.1 hypothetical protein C3B44_09350 [Corynebacterium yudongzhengii]PWC02413.1 hypothetical protein DF222_01920 [Corynebacterium yudongzhengii]
MVGLAPRGGGVDLIAYALSRHVVATDDAGEHAIVSNTKMIGFAIIAAVLIVGFVVTVFIL